MDLLADLERSPAKLKTFRKEIDISIAAADPDDNDTQPIIEDNDSLDFFGDRADDLHTEIPSSQIEQKNKVAGAPLAGLLGVSSLLDKVKRRLNGESNPESEASEASDESETQVIETETQMTGTELNEIEQTQIRTVEETQRVSDPEEPTQLITKETNIFETQKITTQVDGDNVANLTYEATQLITSAAIDSTDQLKSTMFDAVQQDDDHEDDIAMNKKPKLFMEESDSEQEEEAENISKPEPTQEELEQLKQTQKKARLQRIKELAEKKKVERLLKEQELKKKDEKDLENKPKEEEEEEPNESEEVKEEVVVDENIKIESYTVKKFDSQTLLQAFSKVKKESVHFHTKLVASSQKDVNISSDSDDDLITDQKSQPPSKKPTIPASSRFKMKEPNNGPENIILEDSDSDEDINMFEHSKSAVLEIKTKFSKKLAEKQVAKKANPALMSKRQLFDQLMNANKRQVQEEKRLNPESTKENDALKQETLDIQALLQKHIEQNNRLREAEELEARKEQGRTAETADDSDYEEEVPDSDVPDSDVLSDDEDNDEDMDAEEATTKQAKVQKKGRRRMVVKDDEEEDQNEDADDNDNETGIDEESRQLSKITHNNDINLGDFGGNLTQSFDTAKIHGPFKNISLTQVFEKGSQKSNKSKSLQAPQFDLFAKLKENTNRVIGEDSFTDSGSLHEDESSMPFGSNRAIQNDDETQASGLTQIDPETQADLDTQQIETTTKDIQGDDDDDVNNNANDEDAAGHVFKRKRLTKRKNYSSDEDDEEEEDTEEQRQKRIKEAERLKKERREYERKMKQKKDDMKAKGLDKMMEAEAEESEDEWHGLGGAEGEKTDEENSEDEAMFDDITKVKFNKAEIEAKIREETNVEDKKLLERILKDVETGKLRKRGKDSEFDLDIDDGEDEVMRSYRIYNQLKKREQLEQTEALRQLAKDKRSKAFFDTITEDVQISKDDVFGAQEENDSGSEEENNPFEIKKKEFKDPSTVIKKKKKVTVAFVQKTLSFISNPDENNESSFNRRYSIGEDDSFTDDLHTLKQNSIIKIASKTPERRNKSTIDLTAENNLSPSNLFKMPSIVSRASFQSLEKEATNQVTVSTSSKATSSSRASIMSFGKRSIDHKKSNIREQRVLKVRKIAAKFGSQNNRLRNLNGDDGFD